MEGDEGECLQGFDCDALVAIAKYCFVLLVIYLFIRSFIQQTLLSTDYVPANGQSMEEKDEINQLQGDQNLVGKNRHLHN